MTRIPRHQMFMEMAQVAAKRSTCFRENVGALIVKQNKVISIGYNGAPIGQPHCTSHPKGKCAVSIHAEVNAIQYAAATGGNRTRSCDLYVTHLPCKECAQYIIDALFIGKVFFQTIYGDAKPIYKMFDSAPLAPIQLLRVMPSGDITSWDRTELLMDV